MVRYCALLGALLVGLGCSARAGAPEALRRGPVAPAATNFVPVAGDALSDIITSEQRSLMDRTLAGLTLRFTDPDPQPEKLGVYELSGPFEVVRIASHQIVFESIEKIHQLPATTTVYLAGDQVWAEVHVDSHAFLARLH